MGKEMFCSDVNGEKKENQWTKPNAESGTRNNCILQVRVNTAGGTLTLKKKKKTVVYLKFRFSLTSYGFLC